MNLIIWDFIDDDSYDFEAELRAAQQEVDNKLHSNGAQNHNGKQKEITQSFL